LVMATGSFFTRLSVRVQQIFEPISPYGIAFGSISNLASKMLLKSLLDNHDLAKDLDCHNEKHCPICKHHHHNEFKIEIVNDYDEDQKSEISYENVSEDTRIMQESYDETEKINKQLEAYRKAIAVLQKRIEGPTNKEMHSLNGNIKKNEDRKPIIKPKTAQEQLNVMREKLNKLRLAHTNLLNQTNQLLSNVNLNMNQTRIHNNTRPRNASNKPKNSTK